MAKGAKRFIDKWVLYGVGRWPRWAPEPPTQLSQGQAHTEAQLSFNLDRVKIVGYVISCKSNGNNDNIAVNYKRSQWENYLDTLRDLLKSSK